MANDLFLHGNHLKVANNRNISSFPCSDNPYQPIHFLIILLSLKCPSALVIHFTCGLSSDTPSLSPTLIYCTPLTKSFSFMKSSIAIPLECVMNVCQKCVGEEMQCWLGCVTHGHPVIVLDTYAMAIPLRGALVWEQASE